jgi:hypothetical protein
MADLTPDQLLTYLTQQGTSWVEAQRERYRPVGYPLPEGILTVLSRFFPLPLLEAVVTYAVPAIDNPPFLAGVQRLVPTPLPDFSVMTDGIAFGDTICLRQRALEGSAEARVSLIFHECVHVCQYSQLGVAEFMRRYVRGWAANGFEYRSIPLEQHAYALQQKFETATQVFAVDPIVRQQLLGEV